MSFKEELLDFEKQNEESLYSEIKVLKDKLDLEVIDQDTYKKRVKNAKEAHLLAYKKKELALKNSYYDYGVNLIKASQAKEAKAVFEEIPGFKNSDKYLELCDYLANTISNYRSELELEDSAPVVVSKPVEKPIVVEEPKPQPKPEVVSQKVVEPAPQPKPVVVQPVVEPVHPVEEPKPQPKVVEAPKPAPVVEQPKPQPKPVEKKPREPGYARKLAGYILSAIACGTLFTVLYDAIAGAIMCATYGFDFERLCNFRGRSPAEMPLVFIVIPILIIAGIFLAVYFITKKEKRTKELLITGLVFVGAGFIFVLLSGIVLPALGPRDFRDTLPLFVPVVFGVAALITSKFDTVKFKKLGYSVLGVTTGLSVLIPTLVILSATGVTGGQTKPGTYVPESTAPVATEQTQYSIHLTIETNGCHYDDYNAYGANSVYTVEQYDNVIGFNVGYNSYCDFRVDFVVYDECDVSTAFEQNNYGVFAEIEETSSNRFSITYHFRSLSERIVSTVSCVEESSVAPESAFVYSDNGNGTVTITGLNTDEYTIVNIPHTIDGKSVTSIGEGAFADCSSLTSITIPNSVTSIDVGAFSGCSSLISIIVDSNNKNYDSRNNCNAIIVTSTNTLIAGCKNTVIPDSVTFIGDYAFLGCSSLTSITIPNSVTKIGWYAFAGCSSLTIYCEAESQPSGWDSSWNSSDCPVVWGYKG